MVLSSEKRGAALGPARQPPLVFLLPPIFLSRAAFSLFATNVTPETGYGLADIESKL